MIQKLLNYLFPPPDVQRLSASRPRSPHWSSVRRQWVKLNPVCEVCGTKAAIEVHHVKPYHLFPELELSLGNLMTLCERDHLLFGHCGEWKAWNPSVRVDAEIWRGKIAKRAYW